VQDSDGDDADDFVQFSTDAYVARYQAGAPPILRAAVRY
jgi:hypothetical protein